MNVVIVGFGNLQQLVPVLAVIALILIGAIAIKLHERASRRREYAAWVEQYGTPPPPRR